MAAQTETHLLFKDILDVDYLSIHIDKLSLEDDLINVICSSTIYLSSGEKISGEGNGIVDAVFNALFNHYSQEYQSLKSIEMTRFTVNTDRKTKTDPFGTSAVCEVSVETINSKGKKFFFKDSSRSVSTSLVHCAAKVAEHFINSEKAYVQTWKAYKDAVERNRQDLVQKYLLTLALLVENTSYSNLIESIAKDLSETSGSNK